MGEGVNRRGHSRKWVVEEVESSLRRLDTDYIDLYQAHRPDAGTDIDELLGALSDLVRQGKLRAIGSSTFPAHQIVEGQWVAERRGRERFLCEQPPYSIFVRGIERDVLPVCAQYGMGVIPWSPLAGGWLGGKYRKDQPMPTSGRARMQPQRFDPSLPEVQARLDVVEELVAVAEDAGTTLIDLALGFVIAHPAVTSAIIGPRTMEQLDDQLPSLETALSDEVLDRIDAIVPPGTNLNQSDAGWEPPAIADKRLRRR
jgi:aryl-alcohol dehydrogenase-like predicted oxidoreductase